MIIDTTGSEWKRFYRDRRFWPHLNPETGLSPTWHQNAVLAVDGAAWDESLDLSSMSDCAAVQILAGTVFNGYGTADQAGVDLPHYFAIWSASQHPFKLMPRKSQ